MQPGTVIANRYQITRLIGEGGMGAVYEAVHIAVGRRVAIKILHANIARRPGVVARFEREARAAGAIGHANIIDVIDFGTYGDAPYMVMEHLRGEVLGARLAVEGKLPVEGACAIMGQVLSALGAAHAAGIVHRDLKPDNVFLVDRGATCELVKLLDFGISKFNDSHDESRNLTRPGTLMGTPHYMSPEQAMARPDVDGRADLYSAGVMLYELLTGDLPFNGASDTEILIKICQREEEPRPPRAIDPTIPEELDAIVRRAIAFDRDARFQSAADMLEALRPFGAVGTPREGTSLLPPARRDMRTPTLNSGTPTAWLTPVQPETLVESGRAYGSDRPPARASRAIAPLAIGGALAVAAALGTVALVRARRVTPTVAASTRAAASRPAPPAQPPPAAPTIAPPAAPQPPTAVRVRLAGLPADARVWLDAQETPARVFELERGSTHELRIEAPGREPFTETFVADHAETMRISLAALPPTPEATSEASISARSARGRRGRGSARAGAAETPLRPAGAFMAPTREY